MFYILIDIQEGGPEKLLPHPPLMRSATSKKKELPFKFKLITEKRPALHHEYISVISGSDISASDQGYVKVGVCILSSFGVYSNIICIGIC